MEGHGTSPDNRLYDLEREFHGMRGQVTEQGNSLAGVAEQQRKMEGQIAIIGNQMTGFGNQLDRIGAVVESFRDDQKTRWPQIITVAVAVMTVIGAAGYSYLRPLEQDVAEVKKDVGHIRNTGWTRDDHDRQYRLLSEALDRRMDRIERLQDARREATP